MSHVYASTLFDFGASQLFAPSIFVNMASPRMQPMSQGITVALPSGETIFYTKITKGCPLETEGVTLEADQIVFGLLGFNVILVMD